MQKNIINTATNTVSQGHDVLGSLRSQGQKIAAALHLITTHLHVDEPFRRECRACALELCSLDIQKDQSAATKKLIALLEVGMLSGIISEKNGSIIKNEVKKFQHQGVLTDVHDIASLFDHEQTDTHGTKKTQFGTLPPVLSQRHFSAVSEDKKTHFSATLSEQGHERKDITEVKKERKQKILEYINSKRTAVIKDIIALFPEVSEKTIQRELNVLLEEGKIKRGDKRWSLYVAKTLSS